MYISSEETPASQHKMNQGGYKGGTLPFGLDQFAGEFSGIGRQYRGDMSGRGTPPGDHEIRSYF